ncbi:hypothetical protein KBD59_04110 [Candidatus Gracilibacteria bacterium]|nr:hypothetical protein [Candidatus Gracilibacteria bacterium]
MTEQAADHFWGETQAHKAFPIGITDLKSSRSGETYAALSQALSWATAEAETLTATQLARAPRKPLTKNTLWNGALENVAPYLMDTHFQGRRTPESITKGPGGIGVDVCSIRGMETSGLAGIRIRPYKNADCDAAPLSKNGQPLYNEHPFLIYVAGHDPSHSEEGFYGYVPQLPSAEGYTVQRVSGSAPCWTMDNEGYAARSRFTSPSVLKQPSFHHFRRNERELMIGAPGRESDFSASDHAIHDLTQRVSDVELVRRPSLLVVRALTAEGIAKAVQI